MSCIVCRGYCSSCPCCEREVEEIEDVEGCGGVGVGADCEGCEDCVKEVRRTSYHTARKAHHGLLPGDRYARTVGFDYQVGGGRVYIRPIVRRVHPAPMRGK